MKFSKYGIKKLIDFEGLRHHVYLNTRGFPTIGVGHLLTQSELSSGKIIIDGHPVKYHPDLPDNWVKLLLAQDLRSPETAVKSLVKVPLTQPKYDALVCFVFNIGVGAFSRSTLLKRLNTGDYESVPSQMRRWKWSGGKIVRGLINRRKKEIRMWQADYGGKK
jgi:lysozyme